MHYSQSQKSRNTLSHKQRPDDIDDIDDDDSDSDECSDSDSNDNKSNNNNQSPSIMTNINTKQSVNRRPSKKVVITDKTTSRSFTRKRKAKLQQNDKFEPVL